MKTLPLQVALAHYRKDHDNNFSVWAQYAALFDYCHCYYYVFFIESIFFLIQIIQSIGFQARYIIFGMKILIPLHLIFSKLAVFYNAAKEKQMVCGFY